MKFHEALSKESKANWERICQKLKGKEWDNPTNKECESQLESLEEIAKFMEEPGRGVWHE